MKLRTCSLLLMVACLALLGVVAFAAACGGSDETATTAAPATDTTAAATDTTAAAGAAGGMEVEGLVDNPGTLSVADLQAMNVITITAEHPKKGATEYTGVLLKDIMTAVGVQSGAAVLELAASDGFRGEVTLSELDPNAMIAIADDGTLNAVMPGQSGKAWVSDLVALEFK